MLFKEEQQNNAPAGGKSAWICTGYTRPGMCWLLCPCQWLTGIKWACAIAGNAHSLFLLKKAFCRGMLMRTPAFSFVQEYYFLSIAFFFSRGYLWIHAAPVPYRCFCIMLQADVNVLITKKFLLVFHWKIFNQSWKRAWKKSNWEKKQFHSWIIQQPCRCRAVNSWNQRVLLIPATSPVPHCSRIVIFPFSPIADKPVCSIIKSKMCIWKSIWRN